MEIKKIAIAGAGTMGYSIAEIFAMYGYEVLLFDISTDALGKAKENIKTDTHSMITDRGFEKGDIEKLKNRIVYTSDLTDLKISDLVIECIVENIQIKQSFYESLCQIVGSHTVIASNTSGISINILADAVTNPERFIGMHWFNPPHLVLLIEIIKGDSTADVVATQIRDLCFGIGKKPVIVNKDVPGFVANRIQFAILREVLDLVEKDVVAPEGADDIMKYGLGFRYACSGPLQVADFGGLDTFYHISEYLMKDLCSDKGIPKILRDSYQRGDYGVKTGKGFYDYSGDKGEKAILERNKKLMDLFNSLYGDK